MEGFKHMLLIGDKNMDILVNAIIRVFKSNSSLWRILLIDFSKNELADKTILIGENEKIDSKLLSKLYLEIESNCSGFDAVISVANDFEKGSVKNSDVFEQSEKMMRKNYYLSLLGN